MDILTKICVVVLVVLILLAVPVFINGAVVGPRYKVWYQQEQTKSKMYAQAAKEAELGCQRVFQELQAEEKRADDIAAERDEKVQELKAQLDAERLNSAELGGKLTSINMQIVDLSASYKQYIERAKLFSERLAAQQKTIDKLTTENMALYNQVKQKTADYERFEQIVKGLHEEISEYKELIADMGRTIEALKVGGGGVMRTPGEAPVFGSDIRISGTIDGVDVANNIYKAVQWLIPGCRTMLCSQGVALPVDDLSRGDDEQAIYNVLAANVVKAQAAEAAGKYPGPVDDRFLKL